MYKGAGAFAELCADYTAGALHPGDLKPALARALNVILQPVRNHFDSNAEARDLLKKVCPLAEIGVRNISADLACGNVGYGVCCISLEV